VIADTRLTMAVNRLLRLVEWSKRRPALDAAAICAAVTIWAVLMHHYTEVAKEWMPHIAAAAATIGVTVTIVEGILRRESEERLRPRRESVFGKITGELWDYLDKVALDYAQTHNNSFLSMPDKTLPFLDFWLEQQQNEDAERDVYSTGQPMLLAYSSSFAAKLTGFRESDPDVILPLLGTAIDEFVWASTHAQSWYREKGRMYKKKARYEDAAGPVRSDEDRAFALSLAVKATRDFAEVLEGLYSRAERVPERIIWSANSYHSARHLR
jgi:hypothetical protein